MLTSSTINTLAAGSNPLNHVISKPLVEFGPFYITNHMMMTAVAAFLLLVSAFAYKAKIEKASARGEIVTGRLAQLFETLLEFIREEVARPNLGKLTDKYVGYLWAVFLFILFANVLGLIPSGPIAAIIASFAGADSYTAYGWSYLGGTATGTLALTIPLAITAFIAINWIGYREQGNHYFAHFNPGPALMAPLLVPLEVMGLFIKSAVLAMRLFGTMMAGHLVIAVFLSLIASATAASAALGGFVGVGFTLIGFAIMALELFIALLQAFIFTFLTTLFIAQGAVGHHDEDHDHSDETDWLEHKPMHERVADAPDTPGGAQPA